MAKRRLPTKTHPKARRGKNTATGTPAAAKKRRGETKASAPPGKSKEASRARQKAVNYSKAKRAFNRYCDELRRLPGVTGVSIGRRYRKGKPTRELAIRLHVSSEADKQRLRENAEAYGFKKHYGGVGTDIIVWQFETGAGGSLPDGECIVGDGGPGSLGTTVIIRKPSSFQAVWLTAAHVASTEPPSADKPACIRLCGNNAAVGAVPRQQYFRDPLVDAALVTPNDTIPFPSPGRTIRHLTNADRGKSVTFRGAQTKHGKGIIDSIDYTGELFNTGEEVTDHVIVVGSDGPFAVRGDSGSVVLQGKQLVGMVRAVDAEKKVAVISKLDVARRELGGFDL